MSKIKLKVANFSICLLSGLFLLFSTVSAASLAPQLEKTIAATGAADDIPVIIHFQDRINIRALRTAAKRSIQGRNIDKDSLRKMQRRAKRSLMIDQLKGKNRRPESIIRHFLASNGIRHKTKPLWVINAVATSMQAHLIDEAQKLPGVERITLDMKLMMATPPDEEPTGLPLWNLEDVNATTLWQNGILGQGIVVGVMDSGVDLSHPDLEIRWRGGDNSWFDPFGQNDFPTDLQGHGTQTAGLIVGGDASGYQVGVAPGAQWIAAKIFDNANETTLSAIHEAFQWMLDPDNDPNTDDAPDIVNNSWGFETTINECFQEFTDDISLLKEAGIAVVFSAGNYGPQSETSISPANDPAVISVGSVNQFHEIDRASSRGPSACDGGIFPKLVAPGKNIFTTDRLPLEYNVVSGTSFASPHVAGAMALLKSAFPNATVTQIESALLESATDLGPTKGDDSFGYGLMNLSGAYEWLINDTGASTSGILLFSAQSYSVDESTAKLSVTVRRIGGSAGEVSIDYETVDGTATSDSDGDFSAASGTLTFDDGETLRTIEIDIHNDNEDETNEEFEITLSNPQGGASLGSRINATAIILDDDGPGSLSIESSRYAINESKESVEITVFRLSGAEGSVNVDYMTVDGSATSDLDYLQTAGTLTFNDGETSRTITIEMAPDAEYEGNEDFSLVLSNVTGGADLGNPGMAVVTILEDDPQPSEVTIHMKSVSYTATEEGGILEVAVTRTGDINESVTVDYATSNGTAIEGEDFTQASGRLTFSGGSASKTLFIQIEMLDDGVFEQDETFSITLSNASDNVQLKTPSAAIIRISDNDASPSVSPLSGSSSGSSSTGASTASSGGGGSSESAAGTSTGSTRTTYHFSLAGFGGFGDVANGGIATAYASNISTLIEESDSSGDETQSQLDATSDSDLPDPSVTTSENEQTDSACNEASECNEEEIPSEETSWDNQYDDLIDYLKGFWTEINAPSATAPVADIEDNFMFLPDLF